MGQVTAHARWPEALELLRLHEQAQRRLLELWPDGADPDTFDLEDPSAVEQALDDFSTTGAAYVDVRRTIVNEVAAGNYG